MTKDFKKWWKEKYKKDVEVIHATQKSVDEYLKTHSTHPVIKGIVFDEKITITGNFIKINVVGCAFLRGLTINDSSVFEDFVFKDNAVVDKLTISNVFSRGNIIINQNLGEIISDGMVAVHIENVQIKGKIVFEKD